jgi:GNAT superfamily N-acetyltransferase
MADSPYWSGYRQLRLKVNFHTWDILPRNAAYKYEYFNNAAWLSPRPKSFDAVLRLQHWNSPVTNDTSDVVQGESAVIRQWEPRDWEAAVNPFYRSFARQQPFSSYSRIRARRLATDCLTHTREGHDGPLLPEACFVAESDDAKGGTREIVAGALVTLADTPWVVSRLDLGEGVTAVPHLTWIFVDQLESRRGIGSALLDRIVRALRDAGHRALASTFVLGNDSSVLWHWRNGFELVRSPYSTRVPTRNA